MDCQWFEEELVADLKPKSHVLCHLLRQAKDKDLLFTMVLQVKSDEIGVTPK